MDNNKNYEIEEETTIELLKIPEEDEATIEISSYNFETHKSYMIAQKALLGKRKEQQDYKIVYENGNKLLLVVCDGIGGLEKGAEASRLAAETLKALYVLNNTPLPMFFRSVADTVNEKVRMLNVSGGSKATAGTTMVSVIIEDDKLYWWSIGDSRIYLFRDGEMIQVTQDDNYENKLKRLLKEKEISQEIYNEEIKKGAALISFLGKSEITSINTSKIGFDLRVGDKILMTSDGLYKSMPEERIKDIILSGCSVMDAATILENLVKDIAGDNTTFIIAERIK